MRVILVALAGEAHGGAVGWALRALARELGADLPVMGGYGRSRMRERIFGGVTQHVLDHHDMPVLAAH